MKSAVRFARCLCWLLLVCAFPFAGTTAQTIRGQVINGTRQGRPVPGRTVFLKTFGSRGEVLNISEGKTDASGRFNLHVPADLNVCGGVIQVPFQGAMFEVETGESVLQHAVRPIIARIYDVTHDASNLRIVMHHIMLRQDYAVSGDGSDGFWVVREIIVLRNTGTKAYMDKSEDATGNSWSICFSLPNGHSSFRAERGLKKRSTIVTETAVRDATPVPPGEKTYDFTYLIPSRVLTTGWKQRVEYHTQHVMVLAAGEGIRLSSPQLGHERTEDIGKYKMKYISGTNLEAGTDLELKIETLQRSRDRQFLLIGAIAGLAVIAAIAGYRLLHSRTLRPDASPRSREMLLAQIAELDDRYEAGEMDESSYVRDREELKTELRHCPRSER